MHLRDYADSRAGPLFEAKFLEMARLIVKDYVIPASSDADDDSFVDAAVEFDAAAEAAAGRRRGSRRGTQAAASAAPPPAAVGAGAARIVFFRKYLNLMYSMRFKWARCFVMTAFKAGLDCTTNIVESQNAIVKLIHQLSELNLTNLYKKLVELAERQQVGALEAAGRTGRGIARKGDLESSQILRDAAAVLTPHAALMIKDAVTRAEMCKAQLVEIVGNRRGFWVRPRQPGSAEGAGLCVRLPYRIVNLGMDSRGDKVLTWSCTCEVPSMAGVPCKHIACAFNAVQHIGLPSDQIHPMWFKHAPVQALGDGGVGGAGAGAGLGAALFQFTARPMRTVSQARCCAFAPNFPLSPPLGFINQSPPRPFSPSG